MDWNKVLAGRVASMEESATLLMAKLGRELKEQGHQIISLSLGEPDFDTPGEIKEAAKQALDKGYTKYGPVSGVPEFKKAIQKKMARDNNIHCSLSQIMVSNGAKQSIANAVLSLVNPGDEIILFAPYWVSYKAIAEFAGAKVTEIKAGIELDYKVTAAMLEEKLNEKTKLIIFSSPCNPSGSVFSRDEIYDIAKVLKKYPGTFIIADEIYEYINFNEKHFSIGSIEEVKDQVITVNGMSKGFSMTGWRLGYLVAHEAIAGACEKIQGQFTSGASTFSQHAAAFALENSLTASEAMCRDFRERKRAVAELLNDIRGFKSNDPKGAFYLFPDVSELFGLRFNDLTIKNADDLSMFLLKEAHVATVSGSAFGSPECLRISYAASMNDLIEAMSRIKNAVNKLV